MSEGAAILWLRFTDFDSELFIGNCLISSDFDEQDRLDSNLLRHELLRIPYTGTLEPGLFLNAMDVRNRQNARVDGFKFSDAPVYDSCLGM